MSTLEAVADFVIGLDSSLRDDVNAALKKRDRRIAELENKIAALEGYLHGSIDGLLKSINQPARSKLIVP